MRWIRRLEDVAMNDVPLVGGKNASLGELLRNLTPLGVNVPAGFAVTAEGYRHFVASAGLGARIREALAGINKDDVDDLVRQTARIRELMLGAPLPRDLEDELVASYRALSQRYGEDATDVAVRSSATAEDLPNASFAGQQESFLNVRGAVFVVEAVKKAFASLFTPRAVSYRLDMGFDHEGVALSVGVQKMVRADLASAGVIFTLDTESGHRGMILVSSSLGLGESVVQGRVVPDLFHVHKPTLREGFRPLVRKTLGTKEIRLVYDEGNRQVKNVRVPDEERARWSLSDDDVLTLARWAALIEEHYARARGEDTPMDIEWAKDGRSGDLFVVQARPETVHSQRKAPRVRLYHIKEKGERLATGLAIGESIAAGRARIVRDPRQIGEVKPGDILVTETTDPDWEPIMKAAAGIVTERGGRTSHAAIVARELGLPAVVGAGDATRTIPEGAEVTISCAEGEAGIVYRGKLAYDLQEIDPAALPRPRTQIMLNVGNPEQASHLSLLPSAGVGLARMEFIFASYVGVHPLALTRYATLAPSVQREVDRATAGYADKTWFLVDRLSQGIGTIAAAFWPRPVILRFSDFKTNEYARLLGGARFEPSEENPMLGWRGASRYYHPGYKEGFLLEVAAVKRVREEFGLTNLKVMIPFCRTPEEGDRVLEAMRAGGLARGERGLEVYVMAEIPSNILLAEEFARRFDGFSIGSNDLTQLILGVDRDSATVAPLFDERSGAVKWACAHLIEAAHAAGRKVGICGQAPSDFPDFAAFLVERGIDSLSLSADAFVRTTLRVHEVEQRAGAGAGAAR
ncbi:phosphoenolpyruvate synthase [Sorangium sp. So ce1036]|uniref:phosphoenolpyruvate synthase n=1 Tax=Sorangium sp. So ce1036 TaxID=3133328 RepID=UPI003F522D52